MISTEEDSEEDVVEEASEETYEEDKSEESIGFFSKFKQGLSKTKEAIFTGIEDALGAFTEIDEDLFEELEENLIMADMGVETSTHIIEELRKIVKRKNVTDVNAIKGLLQDIISDIMSKNNQPIDYKSPTVILVVGVNGAGKTTTIGKLAAKFKKEDKKVMLAAADTFRAAAIDQLEVWANRSDVPLIKQAEKSDPAAVVFDACKSAKAKNSDILLVDTAGRLQNKKNLMDELRKIRRIIDTEFESANVEVFLVLDGTTGQNAVHQAKTFTEVAGVTGLIITKLDGTAKGGIIISIYNDMDIPVRYIGLGEKIEDLQEFNSDDYARALFE
ncbi:MAG: signal recognition particle-docking protein FtsY [Lachnospirales bacterium]